ncbi:RidA family protein [Companilactobacillus jidongensis]|uniref:RidA family protein n=1 Tax=Companilactobacillus jidongensis TaxID=2486006 RepID=UPI000F78B0F1|nr:Rid family detoxifying hydrolase [Companilactobacillus jidongensis]
MNKIPKSIGPYSAYRMKGDLLITSGQLPINPETNSIDGVTFEDQVKQSFDNIKNILELEDMALADILKVKIFLTDLNNFAAVNKVMKELFEEPYPARTAFEVCKLPADGQIEVEIIAYK